MLLLSHAGLSHASVKGLAQGNDIHTHSSMIKTMKPVKTMMTLRVSGRGRYEAEIGYPECVPTAAPTLNGNGCATFWLYNESAR